MGSMLDRWFMLGLTYQLDMLMKQNQKLIHMKSSHRKIVCVSREIRLYDKRRSVTGETLLTRRYR